VKPIISSNTRIRHPEHFRVGDYSIVDDFCYFSTKVTIGVCSHIASGCSVAGGKRFTFAMGDFSSLSSGVKIWCMSNDFVNDMVTILLEGIMLEGETPVEGDVSLGHYTAVGSNSVIMPDNTLPEGSVIGALSFVPSRFKFEPWMVYAGIPIRPIKERNRENVLNQVRQLRVSLGRRQGR
jgi:acetyltransferase-like isoleucine patch superfamily enzyme